MFAEPKIKKKIFERTCKALTLNRQAVIVLETRDGIKFQARGRKNER